MSESAGEVKGIVAMYDTIYMTIVLEPENSEDPMQIFEWRVGEKVKVVGNEPNP